MPSNHLILCGSHHLLPSILPSIRVFSNESVLCIRWPKYWSFSFSISPSNEYSELISFRIDWFDLYTVQGTLKSLLQHHSSKAPILCDPMDCSTPGLPVHHQLLEFTQTHVHWVSDAIQPSHPLSSLSPPALNLSQHQSFQMSQLFASGGRSIGVSPSTSVLPMNIQDWFPLGQTGWISLLLLSKGLSRVFSNTTVQKHQFFGTQLSL